MRILGVDSSGMVASVAVVDNDILVAEYTVNHKKTHSQTLLPMLDEVVKMTELELESIDAIAVAAGPGSFTGLRIGAATVKTLGLALDKPVVAVPTCHGLAYNVWGTDKVVCPILDARRNQVYTGVYDYTRQTVLEDCGTEAVESAINHEKAYGQAEYRLNVIKNQEAMGIEQLCQILNMLGREVIFVGDGIPVYKDIIKEQLKVGYAFAPPGFNRQRAASVAALGACFFADGIYESADEHKPIYLRKSQAEREREEQMKRED